MLGDIRESAIAIIAVEKVRIFKVIADVDVRESIVVEIPPGDGIAVIAIGRDSRRLGDFHKTTTVITKKFVGGSNIVDFHVPPALGDPVVVFEFRKHLVAAVL